MSDRTQSLLRIRPEIPSAIVHDGMSADEQFQNGTLRPVIKLQNELFIAVFKNYITKHKTPHCGVLFLYFLRCIPLYEWSLLGIKTKTNKLRAEFRPSTWPTKSLSPVRP